MYTKLFCSTSASAEGGPGAGSRTVTKTEYLHELRDRLSRLPHRERESVLRYYAGVFDRAGPSADEETMRGLGTPESVASRILDDWERKMEAGRSCSSSACGAGGHYRGPALLPDGDSARFGRRSGGAWPLRSPFQPCSDCWVSRSADSRPWPPSESPLSF